MILELDDWKFVVDVDATRAHTTGNASNHCECGYCKNYYDTVELVYPRIPAFLAQFGVNILGPSELMPFEPAYLLACYRVYGEILKWGESEISVNGISILPEIAENGTFLLWVGELELPWVQDETVEDVISPANLPEFMERMREVWLLRHGGELVYS